MRNTLWQRALRPGILLSVILFTLSACWSQGAEAPAEAPAEESDPERAFTGAARLFQGGWYDQAEKELGAFLAAHPASTNRTEAVLLQAQSRFQLKNYEGAIQLLEPQLKEAGPATDQFLYWLAQSQTELDRFEAAANTYAELLKTCPTSPLRLEASVGEALARFKLGDTARTVDLLKAPEGAFQQAAKSSANDAAVVRGSFLLAESLFAQKNFQAAELTLNEMAARGIGPDVEWERQYLLARIELLDRRGDAALLRATNLVTMATSRSNALLQARSLALKGEILEEKQPEVAAQAYASITQLPGVSVVQKRQALLQLANLAVAQNRLTNAVGRLTEFLEQNPQEPAGDLIRFTLGEIHLKRVQNLAAESGYLDPAVLPKATNLLQLARAQFDYIITQLTNSVYIGKAYLGRGWCLWEEAQLLKNPARLVECQKDLHAGIAKLPKSLDQARARFKLADCHFQLKNYTNALTHYRLVIEQYSDLPEIREKLFDQALSQAVLASINSKDFESAKAALDQLLRDYPKSPLSARALFDYGQALTESGEFGPAQEAFADVQKRYPDSPLLPEIRLASARAFARQTDWKAAIQGFDQWLNQFTNHVLRPQAEFDRAWCYYQSGNDTNAYVLFTNLVQRFPSSSSVPLAHLWLGDHYLNQRDYVSAERSYQLISTNSVPVELIRQASLMAAKAAFFRQGWSDARGYLTPLVDDPQVGPEAWFMLGDIELADPSSDATNRFAKFEEAIKRFQRVTNFYSSSPLAPLAMGKIANCHFQLAAMNTNRYEMATNQYFQLLSIRTDVATRSQAEVALGHVLEKMAEHRANSAELLNAALAHYLNVVYGKRLQKGEDPDPFWMSRAAMAAGTLAVERLQRFEEAERLYLAMMQTLPSLNAVWEKRLAALRQQQVR